TPSGTGMFACSDPPNTGDFPCDVFAIIHANCNRCHQGFDPATMMMPGPKNGAPFPLLKFEDVVKVYSPPTGPIIWKDMARVIKSCEIRHMPFAPPELTADQYKTLSDWLNNCAPPVPAGMGCECPDGWHGGDAGNGCF